MNGKVVLAYSGGLDTSICIPILKENYDFENVITVIVDVGQPIDEITNAHQKAEMISDKNYTIDAKTEFVEDYIFPLIKANGNYEGYVLGTAIARPLIAKKVLEIAKAEDAEALAHGCTGKGNDQLRFEVVFRSSDLKVLAPMRDMNLTREWEINYAKEHNIPVTVTKENPWSIDENIWSRSIEGGRLEDPDFMPPEEIFEWTSPAEKGPESEIIEIAFSSGIPVSLNKKQMDGVSLINELNRIGGIHGVGRTDMIEDRALGLKARENYEHPAATILLTAHADLERLVLTRRELSFKAKVDDEWSKMAYLGLVDEPLFHDLNAFIDATQHRVKGDVKLKLYKGNAAVVARNSPYALYSSDLVSFDESTIDQRDAEGVAKYHGFQGRLYGRIKK